MTKEEQEVYDAAVEFVELHGGIVLNPHETEHSIMTKVEMMLDEEDHVDNDDLKERKAEAHKNFLDMIGRPGFSYDSIEEMMHGNGLEMDYIEDWIHDM